MWRYPKAEYATVVLPLPRPGPLPSSFGPVNRQRVGELLRPAIEAQLMKG